MTMQRIATHYESWGSDLAAEHPGAISTLIASVEIARDPNFNAYTWMQQQQQNLDVVIITSCVLPMQDHKGAQEQIHWVRPNWHNLMCPHLEIDSDGNVVGEEE